MKLLQPSFYYDFYDYGYRGAADNTWQIVAGAVVALVLTILLYVLVFPEKRKNTLNGFFTFVKNFFDLKYLIIEKILKFFYVLNTIAIICIGFFYLFGRTFFLGLGLIILGPIVYRLVYEGMMLGILLVKNTIEINSKLSGDAKKNQFDGALPFESLKKPSSPRPIYNDEPIDFGEKPASAPSPYENPTTIMTPYAEPAAPVKEAPKPAPAKEAPKPTAAPKPAKLICPSCGSPVDDGAVFCAVCGSKVR